MRCEDVQEILDRCELEEAASKPAEVNGHLQTCTDCSEFAADLQFAASSFSTVPMERFSEEKSRSLMAKISALEAERAEETEESASGVFASIFESLARLVAGPRLAYGLGAAAVMMAVIARLQGTPDAVEVAQVPMQQPAPVVAPAAPIVVPAMRKHAIELASGQVMLSGILMTGHGRTAHIEVPEGQRISTIGKQSAVLELADGTKVAMGGATSVGVAEHKLFLDAGQVGVHVRKGGQGFRTIAPGLSTFVMGTRYIAGNGRVELVEGKVEVSGLSGKAVLAPGQKASAAGDKVEVKQIGESRMRNLYNFFGNLDGRDGLANDLGMTVAQLDQTIDPPVPSVAAPPTTPPAVTQPIGAVRVTPGQFQPLPEPEPSDAPPADDSKPGK